MIHFALWLKENYGAYSIYFKDRQAPKELKERFKYSLHVSPK